MSTLAALPSPKRHKSPSLAHKTYHHEVYGENISSSPTSPKRRTKPHRNAQREPYRTQVNTNFGTFYEEATPIEHHDDAEDPHDLAFPATLNPRASMIDSLALSLDQFSGGSMASPYDSRRRERQKDTGRKNRGHTFSSSVSSDGDIREMMALPSFPSITPRIVRRNSLKQQRNLDKLPSIFAEDEDSVRSRVYDAQRAEAPVKGRSKRKTPRDVKSRSSSASSSVDLGHLDKFQGRLGPAGTRRSRSFDFGSSQRDKPQVDGPIPVESTLNSVTFPGPITLNGPLITNISATTVVRQNSNKSSKSTYVRKPRSGTVGAVSSKPSISEPPPPLPVSKSSMGLTKTATETKAGPGSPHEASFPTRPGFFRRVFGSSKNIHLHAEYLPSANSPSARPSQDIRSDPPDFDINRPATPVSRPKAMPRSSTDTSANKENVATMAKKSSGFFRRRKKSNSNVVPPPLPLTLTSDRTNENVSKGETSPVSSLRAFMDSYPVEEPPPIRQGSTQSFYTPPIASPPTFAPTKAELSKQESIPHTRNDSYSSTKGFQHQKQSSTLRIPHHDSFLADSSSTDELSRRDQVSPVSPISDVMPLDSKPSQQNGARLISAATTMKSNTPTSSSRPNVPERNDSWNSERDGRTTPVPSAKRNTTNVQSTQTPLSDNRKMQQSSDTPRRETKVAGPASTSDLSDYKSAPTSPLASEHSENTMKPPAFHVSHPSMHVGDVIADKQKAQRIFDNVDEEVDQSMASAWLGEAGTERERIRQFYMELFDFTHLNILASLRSLCDRIVLKGETQQVDRLIDAFSRRWCACNSNHGFKSSDVVHAICYSILLLNTDLHLADIGSKMTKTQFIRNALPPIKRIAQDSETADSSSAKSPIPGNDESAERDGSTMLRGMKRPTDKLTREESADTEQMPTSGGPLIEAPFPGSEKGWENQVEAVLKAFYASISQEPLPLFGSQTEISSTPQGNVQNLGPNTLRRTPSTLSKAQSDTYRGRFGSEARSLGARWAQKARSRPRLPSAPGFGSSRTSLDDQSSGWSPSMSSTWSKTSMGRTLASMSVDSFGTETNYGDYQSSIGFANALSQAIIRDDQMDLPTDEGMKQAPLLEDESLELCGAPWAKEGILKHKCHLEGVDKRSRDRNWNDCFAVIEKGTMRLFSFSMNAKSLRAKARNRHLGGGAVGGGNWQDNAEEIWKFALRHTIASALPPPGYSKTRPYVWALSLPTGAVHLFSVGTPDIVKEFVSTANFWSARLSKEPMMGGVSNMEYGWSDSCINRALLLPDLRPVLGVGSPRPSTQLSMRSSIDHAGSMKPKLPGDRVHINEWSPPQQSMFPSQLMEVDQLKALQTYVKNVEEELSKHNELRGPMVLAFSSKHPNYTKAMSNWERKSSYLLREIVKFRTYIDILQSAQGTKEKIYKMRQEEDESRRAEDDLRALMSG